VFLYGGTEEI